MAVVHAEPTIFLWEGRDKRGVKLKGQQVAANPNLVRAELRRQGISPIRVRKKAKPCWVGPGAGPAPRKSPFSAASWPPC